MDKQGHKIHKGDRVRIKDSVTHMYRYARAYNEAIVRAVAEDDLGYPHILVEWDKDHWAYSGEEDGWALEAHFDLVEENMAKEKRSEDLLQALSDLVQSFQGGSEAPEPEARENSKKPESDEMGYEETLEKAVEDARSGEAFIIFVARPESYRGANMTIPRVYVHSKREDAALMFDACMADAAAQAHAGLVLKLINEARDDGATSS